MTRKDKKEIEKLLKENGYNDDLKERDMREVLGEDKKFDDEFDIYWEV